jgi:iduronate 2-sulfatase
MLTKVLSLLLFLVLAGQSLAEDVHLYFLGGQSNGNGRANAGDIPDGSPLASPQTDVSLWYRNTQTAPKPLGLPQSQIIDLVPGSGFGTSGTVYDIEFGPEVAFGRTLADALPDQNVMIVKHTFGGSNLNSDWSSTGSKYAGFLTTANAAIAAVEGNGDNPILMGMIWVQGEADTGGSSATNYATNLTDLISRVRTDLFDGGDAPFVLSRLSDNQYGSLSSGVQSVRAAQDFVGANVANTAVVNTDDDLLFTTRVGDIIHYDANGQISLGNALGAEMIALVPEPSSMMMLGMGGLCLLHRRRRG